MTNTNVLNRLPKEMEEKRKRMEELALIHGYTSKEVLALSQEIDEYIFFSTYPTTME